MALKEQTASPDQTTDGHIPPGGASRLLAVWSEGSLALELPTSGCLVIGRAADADVSIPHVSVSRRHAQLNLGDGTLAIEDLGSANGTLVDGVPLPPGERRPLVLGAVVELGSARVIAHYAPPQVASSPMQAVFEVIDRVAPSTLSIILSGETGVGKEILAERIHALSSRRQGPLVKLHCAALPEQLLETELFGHERGAFTGAVRAKEGLLEAAHGGTVLLDEIGELPATTQAKLLRALESREVLRVGAVRTRPIDVRFIAATHRDLDVLVVMGSFREDLLYRLNGVTIAVPPLRTRTADIQGLAHDLVDEACRRAHKAPRTLSAGALTLIECYRWPGNVRELRNVLDRAVLLSEGTSVDAEHITFGKTGAAGVARQARATPSVAPPPTGVASQSDERARILDALARTGGNQTEAAKLLGMTRRMLMYRLDQLSLPRPRRAGREVP